MHISQNASRSLLTVNTPLRRLHPNPVDVEGRTTIAYHHFVTKVVSVSPSRCRLRPKLVEATPSPVVVASLRSLRHCGCFVVVVALSPLSLRRRGQCISIRSMCSPPH
ncbi:hypothetical protein DEO72_LG4g383 [Vigna unguiculata]|uniref:Uncharacterized protein n=1 Tax=Vigna unguiculata TaxID=3917 RepID=A0A4D6LL02_VIGUN|nr:hypothetical protein DEO72_LG4g383 [Vigna unguiculata]